MEQLLLTALGLGLAGVDPAGALLAVAALAAGARDRDVAVFGGIVLLGTALLGSVVSVTAGSRLAAVDWTALIPVGRLGAAAEALVGLVLLGGAALRLRRRPVAARKPRRSRIGLGPLAALGVLFLGSAVLDPTFLGLVVVAGRGESLPAVVVAHVAWSLLSQVPLVLLLVAMARGGHERAVTWFQRGWARVTPALGRVVTAALLVAGLFLVLDAGWLFATGEFLVPGPD